MAVCCSSAWVRSAVRWARSLAESAVRLSPARTIATRGLDAEEPPCPAIHGGDNLNLRSGRRWDMPSALAKDEYIPAGALILASQEELCRPR